MKKARKMDKRYKRFVFICNLDYHDTGTKELFDIFIECGSIERVTIITDQRGRSRGRAYIEFTEKSSAIKAISVGRIEAERRIFVHLLTTNPDELNTNYKIELVPNSINKPSLS